LAKWEAIHIGRHSAELLCGLGGPEPSATAEMATSNKTAKYAALTSDYHFQPIANESTVYFLWLLERK